MFNMKAETSALILAMEEIPVGEVITYEQIREIIHRDPQSDGRSLVDTARNKLLGDDIVFKCIVNEGYQRLTYDQTVDYSDCWVNKSRRASRKGIKVATAVDFDELTPAKQAKHNTNVAVLRTIQLFTKPSKMKKLSASIEDSDAVDELAQSAQKVIELFRDTPN